MKTYNGIFAFLAVVAALAVLLAAQFAVGEAMREKSRSLCAKSGCTVKAVRYDGWCAGHEAGARTEIERLLAE